MYQANNYNICNIGKESDFEKEMYKAEKMHYAKA